jgi:hypothetical protein
LFETGDVGIRPPAVLVGGTQTMRRILAVIVLFGCALALAASFGCSTEDKAQWQQALGDLRGDNLKMKYFGSEDKTPFEK